MTVDTLAKNIAGYAGFMVLSVAVGVLTELHKQIGLGWIDPMDILDAAIVALLPTLTMMLGAMKLPSVGHEPAADKLSDHEDRLIVTDPPVAAEHQGSKRRE